MVLRTKSNQRLCKGAKGASKAQRQLMGEGPTKVIGKAGWLGQGQGVADKSECWFRLYQFRLAPEMSITV